jgi:hypothetical protein
MARLPGLDCLLVTVARSRPSEGAARVGGRAVRLTPPHRMGPANTRAARNPQATGHHPVCMLPAVLSVNQPPGCPQWGGTRSRPVGPAGHPATALHSICPPAQAWHDRVGARVRGGGVHPLPITAKHSHRVSTHQAAALSHRQQPSTASQQLRPGSQGLRLPTQWLLAPGTWPGPARLHFLAAC